jgi:hypothetical protein
LLIGLVVMGACLAAGALLVPAIRRDVSQIIATLRLLRAPPPSEGVASEPPAAEGAQSAAGPDEPAGPATREMERARWEDIAEAWTASPPSDDSLAVDVQSRGDDVVP